jgi:hypothetical protein
VDFSAAMKRFLIFLFACFAAKAFTQDFAQRYAGDGTLILRNLSSAPLPHPRRAEGRMYKEKHFSAAEQYQDNTVAIFIPKNLIMKLNFD